MKSPLQPTEAEILKQCLDYLKAKKYMVWRQNSGAMKINDRFIRFGGIAGMPDIVGLLGTPTSPVGTILCVEVKRDTKSPVSEAQRAFLSEIEARGGLAFVATSVEDLIARGL